MDQQKIEAAVERLEANLPLRGNQLRLPPELRRLHQAVLRFYLGAGRAPAAGDVEYGGDWRAAVTRLAADGIVVTDSGGRITGAYPFVSEARDFRVLSEAGAAYAMCAFDALAVSSMFGLPTRIESRCRLSGRGILIEQIGSDSKVIEPDAAVFAAIDWNARDAAASCAATLCTEMVFIAGEAAARDWAGEDPRNRELFTLGEAHAFISRVFVPLMR